MFRPKPTKQSRAFEDIASQIENAILEGSLKPGDKLPSERVLEQSFKVSRGTLREALRSLEQKGLISVKVGVHGGAIVSQMTTKSISDSLGLLLRLDKVTFEELSEFRQLLEAEVAAKVAQNATDKEIEELDRIVESMAESVRKDEFSISEIIKEDRHFHETLARFAGNRAFDTVLSTIYETINPHLDQFLLKERHVAESNYQSLRAIVESVRKRQPQKARLASRKHVKEFWPEPKP